MSDPDTKDRQDDDERTVEALTRELSSKLRLMRNREELTDYAVSLLRENEEDAGREERARLRTPQAASGKPFNPIAFGIPLLVVGAVLSATGILIGPGLGIIAIAVLMVLYGLVVSMFGGYRKRDRSSEERER